MKYLLLIVLSFPLFAAADAASTEAKIKAALEHERRDEKARARDANRKPMDTLKFLRFEDDMTVLELLPGRGWYTRILGPVLEEKGKLYLSLGTGAMSKYIKDAEGFSTTEVIPFESIDRSAAEERRYTVPEMSFGIRKIDLVLTFRNMHNFDAVGRANLNDAAFDALKKGGYYGVVDHTRRHMQADSYEVWRRIDPVQIIKEAEAAGFKFVDYSDLHYRADDELRYEVGRKSVTGNTDRFTLLFQKP